jgi:DUF4097 and DUF4098 domain-containing protein YvlB
MTDQRPARSGCALSLGVLLVVAGSLLLASNLFGFSLAWFWTRGIAWFGTYWPVFLILWGAYKVYQRMVHPEAARVGAGEILLLFLIVFTGLTVHFTRQLLTGIPVDVSLDDVIESIGSDISFGPAHVYSEEHRFDLSAGTGLLVENRRGAVTVHGWDEPELKVTVTKRIYRHSEETAAVVAEEIRPRFDVPSVEPAQAEMEPPEETAGRVEEETRPRSDEPARFEMEIPSEEAAVETDLEVWVPRETALTVINGRGPLRVSDFRAPVGLATSQDSIEVRDVTGRLSVNGRRGPVRLERITGDVEARNRYGAVTVKDVEGNLLGETSNGSLYVERITGTARLSNRHSRIRVSRIGGDLTVEASHTEVSAEELGATATIETSYRPIFVNGVEGSLTIETRSSEIEVRDVKENLDVNNTNRLVRAAGIGGGVTLTARKCEVRLDDVAGPIEVESSYNPVRVDNYQSSLIVRSEHAPLYVSSDTLGDEIKLITSYGDVRLTLPPESRFRLDAKVRGGDFFSDFDRSGWEESKREELLELRGTVGGGDSPILIETSYGDIRILEADSK